MVKTWASLSLLAVVVLLPVGSAGGQTDPGTPWIDVHVSGDQGLNRWRVGNTTVGWSYGPPEDITRTVGCDVNTVTEETAGTPFTCTVMTANDEVSMTYVVRLDKTPPTVRPRPTRPADRNGWFNRRVHFEVIASDEVSGVDEDTCTQVPSYGDPDKANIRIRARCRDMAGHRATGTFLLDYDDTAPSVRATLARAPDRYGWYARDVRVSFAGKDAVSRVDHCSRRVYRGPDTARASVTGSCRDRAGNRRLRTRTFKFSEPLLRPRAGSRAQSAPLLDWVNVRRVLEYNAQVWHDGRKILSRWPDKSRLKLDRGWRFQGAWRRLRPGERYTVYVWPRFRRGYGELLSRGGFTFVGGSSASTEVVAAAGLEPATHGL